MGNIMLTQLASSKLLQISNQLNSKKTVIISYVYCVRSSKFKDLKSLSQRRNFKYTMAHWEVPSNVLRGRECHQQNPCRKKTVHEQAILNLHFQHIIGMAIICLCHTLYNPVVERGVSAMKRIKSQ